MNLVLTDIILSKDAVELAGTVTGYLLVTSVTVPDIR